MSVITKAIIPAAGLGTRFLPATKAIPKEMLPIVDIPTIQYVIDEAVSSGIKNILIVVSYNKNAIIRYFHQDHFLEESLSKANKIKELHKIQSLNRNVKIRFVYQHNICGLGDAILCGRKFIGNEPFAVLLGDDVVFRDHKTPPAIKQCIDVYNTQHATVVGVQNVPKTEVSKYGIIQPHKYLSADHRLSAVK
jgi:UTP--glucose-1-phosphate uridylyltransferase